MKRLCTIVIALLATFCKPALPFDADAVPKGKTKFDVAEYFTFLPTESLPISTTQLRRDSLQRGPTPYSPTLGSLWGVEHIDRANGFIQLVQLGQGASGRIQVALWTRVGKSDVVGVHRYTTGYNVSETDSIKFFSFDGKRWSEEAVFPADYQQRARSGAQQGPVFCKFPQVGVDVSCEARDSEGPDNKVIGNVVLKWNKERFAAP